MGARRSVGRPHQSRITPNRCSIGPAAIRTSSKASGDTPKLHCQSPTRCGAAPTTSYLSAKLGYDSTKGCHRAPQRIHHPPSLSEDASKPCDQPIAVGHRSSYVSEATIQMRELSTHVILDTTHACDSQGKRCYPRASLRDSRAKLGDHLLFHRDCSKHPLLGWLHRRLQHRPGKNCDSLL